MHPIKRLWSDRRGNVLAIVGAAIPLVVGSAGLATDTIQWVTWKRELQRAADSAAMAGVLAKGQGAATADSAVSTDLAKHNTTGISLLSGYPQIAYPTSGSYSGAVRVTLAIQKRLGFSSLFTSQAPIITTSATAALVEDGEYCVRALRRDAVAAIKITGNTHVTLGCKAQSNSTGNPSVEVSGSSYTFSTTGVAGAGSLPSSITGTNTADLQPYRPQLPDPFKDKYPTNIPDSEKPCNNRVQNNDTTLSPGCYSEFKFTGNGTVTLSPGVYYLDSTSFDVQGTPTITGTGVTIILTGDTPGSIKLNGEANIQLTAPTTGTYEKMLFIQAANAEVGNANTINGSSSSTFDGAMYLPNGLVNFTGTAANMTKCVMVVGYEVEFQGNANLQNNTTGCVANKTVKDYVVRLVA